MSHTKKPSATALAILMPLLLAAGHVFADDASRGVEPPRVSFTPGNSGPTKIQIHLTGHQVQLNLTLAATQGSARSTAEITTPSFKWRGEGDPYPERQYPELAVILDGRAASLRDRSRAETTKGDITEALLASGIDPFLITDSPPIVDVDRLTPGQLQALRDADALKPDPDAGEIALWSAQRMVSFDLPARRRSSLVVRYLARPAFALHTTAAAELDPILSQACTSESALRQRAPKILAGGPIVVEEYAFDVAAQTAVPSRSVTLDLHAGRNASTTVYATCGVDGAGKVGIGQLSSAGVATADRLVHVVALSVPASAAGR